MSDQIVFEIDTDSFLFLKGGLLILKEAIHRGNPICPSKSLHARLPSCLFVGGNGAELESDGS